MSTVAKLVEEHKLGAELKRFVAFGDALSFKIVDDRGGSGYFRVSFELSDNDIASEIVLSRAGYNRGA
jgi:hypothetical protein